MDPFFLNDKQGSPALFVDASSQAIFVGAVQAKEKWIASIEQSGPALETLFPAVDTVLKEAELELSEIGNFVYCEGPGSVLGLRLAAMAIKTWQQLEPKVESRFFSYNSLQLTAQLILLDIPETGDAMLVSDWKKGAWNALLIQNGVIGDIQVVDDEYIDSWKAPLFHLPQRKGWQKPPLAAIPRAYQPQRILEALYANGDFIKETSGVELYATGANTFKKWTSERHRAPT